MATISNISSDVEHLEHSRFQSAATTTTTDVQNCFLIEDLCGQSVVLLQSTVLREMLGITTDMYFPAMVCCMLTLHSSFIVCQHR